MTNLLQQFVWSEVYRPKTLDQCILPQKLKDTLQQFIDQGNLPNMIFSGSAGVGKTSTARAIVEQLGADYILINGSLEGNIDTLRTTIKDFASSISFSGGRKYIILDEADYLNANSTQVSLRAFMDECAKNCSFILTCNYPNKIIEPLRSRCPIIEFKFEKQDRITISVKFMRSLQTILDQKQIKYDRDDLIKLITAFFPDFRNTLNKLQIACSSGALDLDTIRDLDKQKFERLLYNIKHRDFVDARKWIAENVDSIPTDLFRQLYDVGHKHLTAESAGELIILLGKYQYQAAFVVDQQINFAAFVVECMSNLVFKDND